MRTAPPAFEFEYDPGTIVYGRGCVERLGDTLESRGLERTLVVCGSNVGANSGVMAPVTEGLRDTLVGVFDETTPAKHIRTAYDGSVRMREGNVDSLVCLGGGSSLDVAKVMSLLASSDISLDSVIERVEATGVVPSPDPSRSLTPMIVIPTTLAGADMSQGGGIKFTSEPAGEPPLDGDVRSGRFADPRLKPEALFYDPDLFETTPQSVLAGSAMNGLDKGIETLYSGSPTPITDATAIHGLQALRTSLPNLGAADRTDDVLDQVVSGVILVQYGRRTSIIHAFGHGLSFYYPVQQGAAHGILAPHVLRYVFDHVDGRRDLIAEGLVSAPNDDSDSKTAEEVVFAVTGIRDALGLPSQLREIEGLKRDQLPAIAEAIAADRNLERTPPKLDPGIDEIASILRAAW